MEIMLNESIAYNVKSTAYNARTMHCVYNCESTAYINGESTAYINGESTAYNAESTAVYNAKSTQQNAVR